MTGMPRSGPAGIALLLFGFSLALGGCCLTTAQKEAAGRVGEVSVGVGDFTADELAKFRKATIDMNVYRVALKGGVDRTNLDGSFNPTDTAARTAAARALSSYGSLLIALTQDLSDQDAARAADAFADSFGRLDDRTITDEQVEKIRAMARNLGGPQPRLQRTKAVRELVAAANDDVERACDNLISQCDAGIPSMASTFAATIDCTRADAEAVLSITNLPYSERLIAAQALGRAEEEKAHLELVVGQSVEILQAVKKANEQLASVLKDESLSTADIKAVGAQAKLLVDALRILGLP